MTTGSERFLKVILFVFNVIFAIGGLVSLICGGVALGALKSGSGLLKTTGDDSSLTGAAGLLIAVGVFVFITAILGCIFAMKEHRGGLIFYAVLLVFILILQFAAAIAAFALKGKVQDFIRIQLTTMQNSVRNDTNSRGHLGPIGMAFEAFQKEWKCCGVDGPDDWMKVDWFKDKYGNLAKQGYNATFPGCCHDSSACEPCPTSKNTTVVDCVATKDSTAIYGEGCSIGFTDYMKGNIGIVAGVALTFGLIQILGVVLSCLLARSLKSGHERLN